MEQPQQVGDWLQISVLGSGSFGTVSLWRQELTAECVAVKKCKFASPKALSSKQKERWRLEVAFLRSISHPNIIGYRELDPILGRALAQSNPTGLPLLSMEYCSKGNLRRFLSSEPIRMCGLAEQEVRAILLDVSSGLSHLHAHQIAHRDIKPDNIVLQHCADRPGQTVYKIIDLGYAKELNDATLSFVGTLHYLAPEIFQGRGYDKRVDYWSMGVMVSELVTGLLPFLPEATPFERFERIKDKGPDDICIYTSGSGAVANSTEMKRENFISGCLKQSLEAWLRRALQIDPAQRCFSRDLSAFDFLRFILDQHIVQVFSVYKCEFYSYEVNDCTRLGTLKAWLGRDIKLPANELLFLDSHQLIGGEADDGQPMGALRRPSMLIFAYKGAELLSGAPPLLKLPPLVKELFSVGQPFQPKFTRALYRQALFLVHSLLRMQRALEGALSALLRHLHSQRQTMRQKYKEAATRQAQLHQEIQGFLLRKKQSTLRGRDAEYWACLEGVARCVERAERRQANLAQVGGQWRRLLSVEVGEEQMRAVLQQHDIQPLFDDINGKAFVERAQPDVLGRIRGVVSHAIKLHTRLFRHAPFQNQSQDVGALLRWARQLDAWLGRFIESAGPLGAQFAEARQRHDALLAAQRRPPSVPALIQENALLRTTLEGLLMAPPAHQLE
ncbi:inhibitor of nuclear factor kappa-B kinase subunit alpha [Dendroctonus ponderosae]|uniref:IkappaB kinase n=1 Tax=Dendroctonus ponderosae TaxID=77166 RepID=U4TYD0_DENPD|nr:inhibitor of nuclear factor kappa-B kinase subunit alpha [Dendroctonus ponderosae]ERL86639.1 hypothetical protein D910_04046 [Dendroctonus ponderosae]KAH1003303.1 hypothetical protein HUJ05_011231 [Dendroctonus ponderosae]